MSESSNKIPLEKNSDHKETHSHNVWPSLHVQSDWCAPVHEAPFEPSTSVTYQGCNGSRSSDCWHHILGRGHWKDTRLWSDLIRKRDWTKPPHDQNTCAHQHEGANWVASFKFEEFSSNLVRRRVFSCIKQTQLRAAPGLRFLDLAKAPAKTQSTQDRGASANLCLGVKNC